MKADIGLASLSERLNTRFIGRRVVYRASVSSTMDVARVEAEAGAPEGTVVLAEEQTQGRGRLGRRWLSPAGANIYLSLILRPALAEAKALPMLTPLAVCRAIEEVAGLDCEIKWPNDTLIGGRKVSGMLVEVESSGDRVQYALVGVGINVNFDPSPHEEIRATATSLSLELGRDVSRDELLAAFLGHFEELYLSERDGRSTYPAWKERLDTLGQRIQVRFPDHVEQGLAEDADADGRLLLRRPDGSLLRLVAGDVTLSS
ncbi:MAG: biotin--[acetyl-CoA-carboxylase] ligase [Dehalococcoidia bacterium]|jgi:BirA family biotin operon repressor/biotin-[acetyl-CoA-carboxylase] ligase